jgi:hypothetical protein
MVIRPRLRRSRAEAAASSAAGAGASASTPAIRSSIAAGAESFVAQARKADARRGDMRRRDEAHRDRPVDPRLPPGRLLYSGDELGLHRLGRQEDRQDEEHADDEDNDHGDGDQDLPHESGLLRRDTYGRMWRSGDQRRPNRRSMSASFSSMKVGRP